MRIIGYTYEADVHCVACTMLRFLDDPNAVDDEGNQVHPIFSTDEGSPDGDYCADCLVEINAPWPRAF